MKIEIGRTTVAAILAEAGLEPAPERTRKRTWKHFLRSHWETLYACDFFSVETLGTFGAVRIDSLALDDRIWLNSDFRTMVTSRSASSDAVLMAVKINS